MDATYWHRQLTGRPLFDDMLWSKPENKRQAGKLLIVGGNKFGFAAVAAAYAAAQKAGVGSCRLLLPDALSKIVGTGLAEAESAPSTPSGSFGRQALAQLLELADWADGVLLAGDFGRNSETAILLESFLSGYKGNVTIQQDGLDYFWSKNSPLLERSSTVSAINLGKLQKLAKSNRPDTPIIHTMSLKGLVELLHEWAADSPTSIITKHSGNYIVAVGGQVSTMPSKASEGWQTELGAYVSVWLAQQPAKPFDALSTAVFEYASA